MNYKAILLGIILLSSTISNNAFAESGISLGDPEAAAFAAGYAAASDDIAMADPDCTKKVNADGNDGCGPLHTCALCSSAPIFGPLKDCKAAIADCRAALDAKCAASSCKAVPDNSFSAGKCKTDGNAGSQKCTVKCNGKCGGKSTSGSAEFDMILESLSTADLE